MDKGAVQELFRRAIAESDATVMREGLEHFLGITDGRDLSAEEEYELRSAEFIMEMPQTGERIRGRDAMRSMQEAFPTPPMSVRIRRVMGAHRFWVLEGEIDYGRGPWTATILL